MVCHWYVTMPDGKTTHLPSEIFLAAKSQSPSARLSLPPTGMPFVHRDRGCEGAAGLVCPPGLVSGNPLSSSLPLQCMRIGQAFLVIDTGADADLRQEPS